MATVVAQSCVRLGRHRVAPALGTVYINKRDSSSTSLTAVKRGRGGRSSFSGVVATVFGANGFIGSAVVNRLGKIGSQVIVPWRGDPYWSQRLKLAGDLGQILFQEWHLQDEASIRKAMKYSNTVINLVGCDWQTRNFTYDDVNVKGAETIARIAKEEGVERLIHFSALNASLNPPQFYINGGSKWLRTKAEGENRVRDIFPDATIIRPADVFGEGDSFLWYYARKNRATRLSKCMRLYNRGESTIKQPVYVGDLAQGVVNAALNPDSAGKVYEAIGPNRYYLCDLVDYIYRVTRREVTRTNMWPTFWAQVWVYENFPQTVFRTPLCKDRIEREFVNDVPTGCPTLEDLGIKNLVNIESRAKYDLKIFKAAAYYDEDLGEFAEPEPPPLANV